MYVYTYICIVAPSLEQEIKQKKFSCPYEKLMVNLMYTGNWMKNLHASLLKKYNLSVPQYNVLRILKGQYPKPATVNLIIDRMLDKNSNASRLVDKLLAKGLVERQVSTADRRRAEVIISKDGMELLETANESVQEALKIVKKFSEKDVQEANNFLDQIRIIQNKQ